MGDPTGQCRRPRGSCSCQTPSRGPGRRSSRCLERSNRVGRSAPRQGAKGRGCRRSPATVTLLDAYGLVALVAEEPAAAEVEELLRAGEAGILAVNLTEAVDVCGRVHRVEPDETRAVLEPLFLSRVLSLRPSGAAEAWLAAQLRIRYYDRRNSPLSLADCFLLAHAVREGESIATADPHVAGCARGSSIAVVPLPGSTRARP